MPGEMDVRQKTYLWLWHTSALGLASIERIPCFFGMCSRQRSLADKVYHIDEFCSLEVVDMQKSIPKVHCHNFAAIGIKCRSRSIVLG